MVHLTMNRLTNTKGYSDRLFTYHTIGIIQKLAPVVKWFFRKIEENFKKIEENFKIIIRKEHHTKSSKFRFCEVRFNLIR